MNRGDKILLGLIVVLAGALAWVVYPTLEQKVVNAGEPAPDFQVVTDSGKTVSLKNFGGKLLVLNFWASWCGPCVQEAPSLEEFSRRMAPSGVVVLGVSIDRNEKMYKRFLKDFNITFPICDLLFGTVHRPPAGRPDATGLASSVPARR